MAATTTLHEVLAIAEVEEPSVRHRRLLAIAWTLENVGTPQRRERSVASRARHATHNHKHPHPERLRPGR